MADAKKLTRRIFEQTLASIHIPDAMERKILRSGSRLCVDDWTCDLADCADLRVIAIGKAAHAMLEGFARLFPDTPFTGVASAPVPPARPIENVTYFLGGHPVPNDQSWQSAQAALALLKACGRNSLAVFLLSGGGSALMELPLVPQQSLADIQQLNHILVACGASIDEINAVRKHVSAVKGGRLAVAATPATKLTLAISDVPRGKESALASGPTLPDPTTCVDVQRILDQYAIRPKLPLALKRWFEPGQMPETPKQGTPAFENAHFSLLLGVHDLFHAAHHAAEAEGIVASCDNSTDDWPIARAADWLLAQLDDLGRMNPGRRVALIADGELSSAVTGDGLGGRNSAFVLACVEKIAGRPIAILSAGTDGVDGNSPAAGATADGSTLARAKALGMSPQDFFRRSDAYRFFEKLGDAILTGPTGNNLRDLRVLIAEP
jgi:hydroxypyruvate reductase